MRLNVGTMQATDILALYLPVKRKFIIKAVTPECLMLCDHFCGHIYYAGYLFWCRKVFEGVQKHVFDLLRKRSFDAEQG